MGRPSPHDFSRPKSSQGLGVTPSQGLPDPKNAAGTDLEEVQECRSHEPWMPVVAVRRQGLHMTRENEILVVLSTWGDEKSRGYEILWPQNDIRQSDLYSTTGGFSCACFFKSSKAAAVDKGRLIMRFPHIPFRHSMSAEATPQ